MILRSVLAVFILLFSFAVVSAHEIKKDGSMSVLLHMEPQDSPVVNESARLLFSVDDETKKFSYPTCDCRVEIKDGDQVISSQKLDRLEEAYGENVASVDMTFPHKGIYTVNIKGQAINSSFQAFSLDYNVRIERENISQAPVNPIVENSFYIWYYIGLGVVVLVAIILIVRNQRKK